ncbi:MFS transporter [Streptomyces sp. TRM76323]|uniref:MFS transporter n=1 Tax=Streptomyces tamarix TaxID=3078565 RepID=A0ABU3QT70_9ACTN|nr:MFS transporter [Streptomyces tamarix]MDT9685567.1 MFS transporter [Streptomyces tamarix]
MALTGGSTDSGAFRLLWAGQTVSVLGDGAALLAVPLLMLQITGSPLLAALAATPRTVAYLLVGLLAGPLADRWNMRRVLVWCDVARAVLFALMPLTVHVAGGAVLLLLLACLAAAVGVLFETSMTKAVQSLLRPEALVTGNARLEMSSQLGVLLGPAMIGGFMSWVGVEKAIWLNAATFAASISTLLPLRQLAGADDGRPAAAEAAGRGTTLWRDMREGMSYLRSQPLISRLVTVQAAVNFVIAAETLVVFHATTGLHASAAWAGAIVGAAGVGGVLAAALADRLAPRTSPGKLIGWSVVGIGCTLLGFALSVHPVLLLVANLLHGALSIFASVHIRALRQKLVPPHLLGRVTANARTLAFVANPLGAALFGGLTGVVGGDARFSFAVAALFSVVSGMIAYRGLVVGAPAHPEEEPGASGRATTRSP